MGEPGPVLSFDVGNTRLKAAAVRGRHCTILFGVETRPLETLGERLAHALGRAAGAFLAPGARCVASSVCPAALRALEECCRRLRLPEPQVFGRDLPIPIQTLLREPGRVGSDRLLCALGARALLGAPCIAVAVGTAITVDLVDGAGRFAGGAIAPGPRLAARALHEGTALLPLIEPRGPVRIAGLNTEEAIVSGIHAACTGGVRELIAGMERELGEGALPVALTGGDALLLLPLPAQGEVRHVPELIFLGMAEALAGV